MARFTAPHALSSRGETFPRFLANRARRACAPPMPCAGVFFPSHDREADPKDVPVAARSMRPCSFSRCLEGNRVVDRSAETAAFHPTREGRTTRSIRDVFHRTISPERRFVAEDALDADALSHRLATMRSHTGFLTWPLEDLHRLAPIQIGSSWFLRPTPRSAVTRHAHPCGSAHAVGGPDLAVLPPRSWARRRFTSGVSAPSAIRSMQRSGFPRRCTFRLRRRRSTSTDTPNVGTDSSKA
jgi:hypothetical protein